MVNSATDSTKLNNIREKTIIQDTKSDETIIKLITSLSDKKIDDVDEYLNKFDKVYVNNYRHKYSQILQFLIDIGDEPRAFLVMNIEKLYSVVNSSDFRKKDCFNKLYDHIILETTRLTQYNQYVEKEKIVENKVNRAKKDIDDMSNQICEAQQKYYAIENQIQNFNAQSISILGVFSAIVMAFFGGLNVLGSILSKIDSVSKYKLIFMGALTGFIDFNIIFLLLYFIAKILDKNIGTSYWGMQHIKSKDENNRFSEYIKQRDKSDNLRKFRIRYPIVFYCNLFLILIMISVVILWSINKYYNLGI